MPGFGFRRLLALVTGQAPDQPSGLLPSSRCTAIFIERQAANDPQANQEARHSPLSLALHLHDLIHGHHVVVQVGHDPE
jgi:hypothetical protein